MTKRLALTSFLGLLLSCGPADDVGAPPPGSTGVPLPAAPARDGPVSAGARAAPADPSRPTATPGARSSRVVFLGTSLTAGLGLLRDAERFTDLLQARADSLGLPVEVVNAGVSGETTAGGLRRLDWLLSDSLDALVIELGANDGLRGIPVEAMEENLLAIVRGAHERYPGLPILLISMEAPPNLGPRYTADFRDAFARVAREADVALGPFLLEGVAGVADLNQEDRIHPNARGHGVVATNLWPHFADLVRAARRRRGS